MADLIKKEALFIIIKDICLNSLIKYQKKSESFKKYDKYQDIFIPQECISVHNTDPKTYVLKLKDEDYKYTFFIPKNKVLVRDGNIFLDTDMPLAYQELQGIRYPKDVYGRSEKICIQYRDYTKNDVEHLLCPDLESRLIEDFNKFAIIQDNEEEIDNEYDNEFDDEEEFEC